MEMIQQIQNKSFDNSIRLMLLNDFNEGLKLSWKETNASIKLKTEIPIVDWLEENLILPDSFPIPGPFRIKNSPHLREPLEMSIHPEVRSITLMGCSQMAKTLFFICCWAYDVANDPCPSLYAHPTDGGVKAFAMQKLEPVINSTPILKKIIAAKRRGNTDESSTRFKIYPSGWIELISLQSPGKTRQRSVRKVFSDDGDELKLTVRSEGSPHANLETRTTVYKYNYKHYYGSTPREENSSFIEMKYKAGSQAHYKITCPHCQTQQIFDEDLIVWEREKIDLLASEFFNKFNTAKIKCKRCEYQFSESERIELLQGAKWVHKFPDRIQHLSYQLGKASSTLGSLEKIAEAKVAAELAAENGDDSLFESYVNNEKGLPYRKIVATEVDAKVLIDRREDYIDPENKNVIPNGVLLLTGFVDAQAGSQTKPARFEGEVWGWGYGEECWIVDKFVIEGNPEDRNTREKLKQHISSLEYVRKDGLKRTVRRWGYDSGWASQSIYEIAENKWDRWCVTKGSNRVRASLLPQKISFVNNGKTALLNLGSQAAKHTLFLRLLGKDEKQINIDTKQNPESTEATKKEMPGRIHHTKHFCDISYFDQLTAEHAVPITQQFKTFYVYQKKKSGLANEAIDLWCGAYAMMKSLNVNWKKYKASIDAKVGALSNQEETSDDKQTAGVDAVNKISQATEKPLLKKSKLRTKRAGINPVMDYGGYLKSW